MPHHYAHMWPLLVIAAGLACCFGVRALLRSRSWCALPLFDNNDNPEFAPSSGLNPFVRARDDVMMRTMMMRKKAATTTSSSSSTRDGRYPPFPPSRKGDS